MVADHGCTPTSVTYLSCNVASRPVHSIHKVGIDVIGSCFSHINIMKTNSGVVRREGIAKSVLCHILRQTVSGRKEEQHGIHLKASSFMRANW